MIFTILQWNLNSFISQLSVNIAIDIDIDINQTYVKRMLYYNMYNKKIYSNIYNISRNLKLQQTIKFINYNTYIVN